MIIQCPSCHARYNYDDKRFAGLSTKKIRCTRCTSIFEIVNPAAGAKPRTVEPIDPAPPANSVALPGPDDFALDETALTEASKRRRAIPGAPARAVAATVPANPIPNAMAQEATAPPPGFGRASTTEKAPV
ncbi:MAG: zinc-ribbon domain-containing protein, partial [Thermoanaerobaculia bacterium]